MTTILDENGMMPAVYRGVDVTGQKFGQYTVLGKVRTHRYPSGRTHQIWLCRCDCGSTVETQAQKAYLAKFGCRACNGKNTRGSASPHWSGGRYVPAYFTSKVKAKLSRGRDIEFLCSIEYLDSLWEQQAGRCAYTSVPLSFGDNANECTASLDRIDSSGNYEEGNVQFVHKVINIMKWNLSDSDFKAWCRKVVENE